MMLHKNTYQKSLNNHPEGGLLQIKEINQRRVRNYIIFSPRRNPITPFPSNSPKIADLS